MAKLLVSLDGAAQTKKQEHPTDIAQIVASWGRGVPEP